MISIFPAVQRKALKLWFGPTPNYAAHLADATSGVQLGGNEFNVRRNGNQMDVISGIFYYVDGNTGTLADATGVWLDPQGANPATWAYTFGYGPYQYNGANAGIYCADSFGNTARMEVPLGNGQLDIISKQKWNDTEETYDVDPIDTKLPYASQYIAVKFGNETTSAARTYGVCYHSHVDMTNNTQTYPDSFERLSLTPYQQGYGEVYRVWYVNMSMVGMDKDAINPTGVVGNTLHTNSMVNTPEGWDLFHRVSNISHKTQISFNSVGHYTSTTYTPNGTSNSSAISRADIEFDYIQKDNWWAGCSNYTSSWKILYTTARNNSGSLLFGHNFATLYPIHGPDGCDDVNCDQQVNGSIGGGHQQQTHAYSGFHPHLQHLEWWRYIFLDSTTPNSAGGIDNGNPDIGWYTLRVNPVTSIQYIGTETRVWAYWNGVKFTKTVSCTG